MGGGYDKGIEVWLVGRRGDGSRVLRACFSAQRQSCQCPCAATTKNNQDCLKTCDVCNHSRICAPNALSVTCQYIHLFGRPGIIFGNSERSSLVYQYDGTTQILALPKFNLRKGGNSSWLPANVILRIWLKDV